MKKRILVADDDASVRAALAGMLKGAGYEVALAQDGPAALARFQAGSIDLCLLDIGLGDQSGWAIFEQITSANPCVPIIVITGHSGQLQTARAAGVGALMEKPIDPSRLLQTIEDLLSEPEEVRLSRMLGYSNSVRHMMHSGAA